VPQNHRRRRATPSPAPPPGRQLPGAPDLSTAPPPFKRRLTDRTKIALGAPVVTNAPTHQRATAKITPGSVDAAYLTPGNALTAPVTLTYRRGRPAADCRASPAPGRAVTVTTASAPPIRPARRPIPMTAGAISFGGINVSFTGTPADRHVHGRPNTSGVATTATAPAGRPADQERPDQRQHHLPVGLRGDGQLCRQQDARSAGQRRRRETLPSTRPRNAQQSVSGVNLDEEAATCCATSRPTRRRQSDADRQHAVRHPALARQLRVFQNGSCASAPRQIFEHRHQPAGHLQSAIAKTQQQLSTGRRVLTAADDPIASARALEVTQSQSVNTQLATNRQNARTARCRWKTWRWVGSTC
jgi:hypothetical protein